MKENFNKLANKKDWTDPNSPRSPKKFTLHRQRQLVEILKKYGGKKFHSVTSRNRSLMTQLKEINLLSR